MKNKFFKRIMSLVLVVVMAVSTMIVSSVSASAETTNVTYKFDVHTAGTNGKSSDKISIKVNGENVSTGWHNVGKVANARTDSASFSDINVGNIQSITVKNSGSNGWYPEYINVTLGDKTTTIYGGRWVDDKNEVTLSVTDRAAKVTIQTCDLDFAGTDDIVRIQLFDENNQSSEEINLTDINPKTNAFERGNKDTFYILVPEDFGRVSKIVPNLSYDWDIMTYYWCVAYIDVTLDGETQRFCDLKNKRGIYFPVNFQWEQYTQRDLFPAPYIYKVTVKTSDKYLAGTDGDIYLRGYNSSNKQILNSLLDNSENNFERNDTDVFYITISEKIEDIKMYKYGVNDWHCDYVQLDQIDISTGEEKIVESVKYKFNKWLEKYAYDPRSKEVLFVENKV